MSFSFLLLLIFVFHLVDDLFAAHFNGGTITWAPITPTVNSSLVPITIIQEYSWSYPLISCAPNVPISTPGRSSQNGTLNCVLDCSTDGGYSNESISILTDCQSANSALGMLSSSRAVNVTLEAGAHFSLAYQGSAWRGLDSPPVSGSTWSILCSIDLRFRPDGLINTPPVSSVSSPQYVVPNTTVQITIPVSDVNPTDDLRCRWSTYTAGYRRRRRSHFQEEQRPSDVVDQHRIVKRGSAKSCSSSSCKYFCETNCLCTCSTCQGTTCSNGGNTQCQANTYCPSAITTTKTTRTTTTSTAGASTTIASTTTETLGTFPSTSSFPHQNAIDECGGICFPAAAPNSTTLSNCTLTFTGLIPNTWYAVALQVEDFFSTNSTTPMSSVPVQFLIYVLPIPVCSTPPTILPVGDCSEAQIGVTTSFQLDVINNCDPTDATIADLVISTSTTIQGVQSSNLTQAPDLTSATMNFTWTPTSNQNGSQQFCVTAFTSERVQSDEFCLTYNISSDPACPTTTSSTSTSTSTSTSSTSSTTSSTSTSTSSTSTTTSSTSTSSTTSTSTSATTSTQITTTKNNSSPTLSWLLILGLALLALLLLLCALCCSLYHCCWSKAARRRRRRKYLNRETNKGLRDLPLFNGRSTDEPTITSPVLIHPKRILLSSSQSQPSSPKVIGLNQLKTNVTPPSPPLVPIDSSKDKSQLEELDEDNPTERNETLELREEEIDKGNRPSAKINDEEDEERQRRRQASLSSVSVKRVTRSQSRSATITTNNPTLSAPPKNLSQRYNHVNVRKIERPKSSDHP